MKRIINCDTGEVIERELTAEEIAEQKATEAEFSKAKLAEEAKAEAKAELLVKLGITEEEAKLLLG